MAVLQQAPARQTLLDLLGEEKLAAWERFRQAGEALYTMEALWSDGGKRWTYEYKYRRGGKTLCALYVRPGTLGLMVIFGAAERAKLAPLLSTLAPETQRAYDEAATYHDGKWVMFDEALPLADLQTLLSVKRQPDRKGLPQE